MLATMKNDYNEFQRAYDETPDTSIGAKARLKASLEEKKEDISKTKADKDSDKKQDKSVEKDSKLVNTLHISDSKNIEKYIILIVIGLTIIYIIYINRSEVKNK